MSANAQQNKGETGSLERRIEGAAWENGSTSERPDRANESDLSDHLPETAERGLRVIMNPDARYLTDRIAIDPSTGCWNWTLKPNRDGYGAAVRSRENRLAHRLSYATFKGDLLPGMVIHHACFNTLCINPDHLEQVTGEENLEIGGGREEPTTTLADLTLLAPVGHGTVATYMRRKCRCNWCREANRIYFRERRVRLGLASRPAKGGYAKVRGDLG